MMQGFTLKKIRFVWIMLLALLLLSGCEQQERVSQRVLVVANKGENRLTILDPDSGEIRETVVTGVEPHEVSANGAVGLAVVSNHGSPETPGSSLTIIDLFAQKSLRTIGLGRFKRPHGVQLFKDGSRVAVTVEGSRAVLVVRIDSGEIEKVIPTRRRDSHLLVLSPDGERAYVTNVRSGSVSVLDLPNASLLDNIPTGRGAEGIDVSPNGTEVWIASREDDSLSILDTRTLEVMARLDCSESPVRLKFTPSGNHVLVSTARSGDLVVFAASDRREVARIPMTLEDDSKLNEKFELSPVPIGIVTNPEGTRAYVANTNTDSISIVDLTTWKLTGRLQVGEGPEGLDFVVLDQGGAASEPEPEESFATKNLKWRLLAGPATDALQCLRCCQKTHFPLRFGSHPFSPSQF